MISASQASSPLSMAAVRQSASIPRREDIRSRKDSALASLTREMAADFGPLGAGRGRDRRPVGHEWLPLAKLADFPLSPSGLGPVIARFLSAGSATYLGDVH